MLYFIMLFYLASITSCTVDDHLLFRGDYKYIKNLKSFFKIHTEHKTWTDAEKACAAENAEVFYPKTIGDAEEFVEVLSFLNVTHLSDWEQEGISKIIQYGHEIMLDGIPISDLYSNWGPTSSETGVYPFVCKKALESLQWNSDCNTAIPGYIYNKEFDHCYKFHEVYKNWTEAYDICRREQSYLAVINSHPEALYYIQLITKDNDFKPLVHLGFHNMDNKGWRTVNGTKLEDSGYTFWGIGQPDGPSRNDVELCGSMFYYGELNDIGCEDLCMFICEHEIRTSPSLHDYNL